MKILHRTVAPSAIVPKAFAFYFQNMTIGVLDIETTGLDPRRSAFVLGGLLVASEDEGQASQYFAENLSEEQEVLRAFLDATTKVDFLLTYNGQRFDLPFLQERAKGGCPPFPFHLDLYQVLDRYSPLRRSLPNLQQKTIESFLGLWENRKDEITGRESVALYYQYVATGDAALREKILLHNSDDIHQLYRLVAAVGKSDFHRAMYHMGFPVAQRGGGHGEFCIVERIALEGNRLDISGRQQGKGRHYQSYEFPFTADFDGTSRRFQVSAPLMRHGGLALADLQGMGLDTAPFEKYPTYGDGFLVLEKGSEKCFLEINHVVKAILERMMNQWITKK